jgi:multiple sugar transport system substrate-binding protein
MSNDALQGLLARVRDGQITRRQMVKRATALGFSLTAIGSSLRSLSVSAQSKVEVLFWTTATEPELTAQKAIVDEFNKQDPNLQTKLVQVVGNETDTAKLMTAVRGGSGPDVYRLDRFTVAERAAEGVLQDISSNASEAGIKGDEYVAFAWAEANYNGKLYALPVETDARAIYYNKDMIKAAGADPAELDATKGPVTFDKLNEIADKMNKMNADGNYSQLGFVPWFDQGWHYSYGFAFGGTFFDESKCDVTPTQEGVIAGHQYLYDYAKKRDPQKLNSFIGNYMLQTFPPANHPFITKTLGMVLTGDWFMNNLKTYAPDIDYGITFIPIPSAGAKSATWAGGWSLVVPQGAKHPDEAFKFMNYMAGEPGQRAYTKQSFHLPTLKSLLADDTLFDAQHLFFAKDLLPTAKSRPPLPVGAKYWDELTTAWQSIYHNQSEPMPALQQAHDRVQPQLQQYCPVKITT